MCAGKAEAGAVHSKTNAMRILDQKKIPYKAYTYDGSDGRIDGIAVAEKIGKEPGLLYKTLVARGASKEILVFIVCVEDELDLKKAARTAGEKSVAMVQVKELLGLTGYIRGGCSPVGMKKSYRTFVDSRVNDVDQADGNMMIVSGGKIGMQLELERVRLIEATNAVVADLCTR